MILLGLLTALYAQLNIHAIGGYAFYARRTIIAVMTEQTKPRKERRGGPRLKTRLDDLRGAYVGEFSQQPHVPTPELRDMAFKLAHYMTEDQIAYRMKISKSTLRRYYMDEVKGGLSNTLLDVGQKMINRAVEGDKTCMIFVLKTLGKWSQRIEVTGADGGPVQTAKIDLSKLNDEELALYGQLCAKFETDGDAAFDEELEAGDREAQD